MDPITALQIEVGAKPDGSFGPETVKKAMVHFNLSKSQTAHFFGQCAHESGGFTVFSENLNYSESGLLKIFPSYFKTVNAADYARQPIKIANHVYANRNGNGPESSGDGWKYRGRGAIQLTGKANYQSFALTVSGDDILANPDLVAVKYAFDSAKWFFDKNNLWALCGDIGDDSILKVTKRINGGTNGYDDRKSLTKRYFSWL